MAGLAGSSFFKIIDSRYYATTFPWAEDLGIFNQPFWLFTQTGELAPITIRGYNNILANHFSPIFFFLAPFYALQPGPQILLMMVIGGLCLSAVIIFLLANKILSKPFQALLIAAAYITYLPFVKVATLGFRMGLISVPFLSLGLLCYFSANFWAMMLALILAAFCKEEVPLILIGFSLLACYHRRRWYWRLTPALFGLFYFVLVVGFVMPWLNNSSIAGGAGFETYRYLGSSFREIAGSFVFSLPKIFEMLTREHVFVFLHQILIPLFYLPILGWPVLLVPLSQYLVISLASYTYYASISYWYFAPLLPFTFAAMIIALKNIEGWSGRANKRLAKILPTVIIIIILASNLMGAGFKEIKRGFDLKYNKKIAKLEEFIKLIPPEDSLLTHTTYIPYFSARSWIYLPSDWNKEPEYLLLEFSGDPFLLSREDFNRKFCKMLESNEYGLVKREGQLMLFKKGACSDGNQQILSEFLRRNR